MAPCIKAWKMARHRHMPIIAGYVFNIDKVKAAQIEEQKELIDHDIKFDPNDLNDSLSEDSLSDDEQEQSPT